jgi:hypothetical protein
VGYTLHLTETCDPDQPDLITPVITMPATTPDGVMGPSMVHDLAARDLLPGTHVLDSGYVDADFGGMFGIHVKIGHKNFAKDFGVGKTTGCTVT